MSELATWRPGETKNPGFRPKYGDGSYIPITDVVEILATFKVGSTLLAKHSFTDRTAEGYIRLTMAAESVGGVNIDTVRLPMDEVETADFPTEGKVQLTVSMAVSSTVFPTTGYIKVFDKEIAKLAPSETELDMTP